MTPSKDEARRSGGARDLSASSYSPPFKPLSQDVRARPTALEPAIYQFDLSTFCRKNATHRRSVEVRSPPRSPGSPTALLSVHDTPRHKTGVRSSRRAAATTRYSRLMPRKKQDEDEETGQETGQGWPGDVIGALGEVAT